MMADASATAGGRTEGFGLGRVAKRVSVSWLFEREERL